jgi:uncharacterized protein with HEPN domain
MLRAAEETSQLVAGRTRADLDADRLLNLGVTRLLEIVGEAATRVTEDTRSQHTEIPWAQITALRNRLIHGYDNVDFDIIWDIVQLDLPPLIAQLQTILGSNDTGLAGKP